MKTIFSVLGIAVLLLFCSNNSPNNGSNHEFPLIEGESYYLDQRCVRSILLGEYRLIDGQIVFADSLTDNVYTVKLIQ